MDDYNSRPFASTPLRTEQGLTQVNPMPLDEQFGTMMPADQLESEYPDIYFEVIPLVTAAADRLIASGYNPTSDMIDALVDTIIKNSGMWYEDDDDNDPMMDAIPAQVGFGRNPFRRRRRRHHNRNSLRDVIRILLLRELFDRRGRRRR